MSYKQSIRKFMQITHLFEAQCGCCYICGEGMPDPEYVEKSQQFIVTVDHVYPRNLGHDYLGGNALLAHGACNNKKGDRHPTACEIMVLAIINEILGWDGECYSKTPAGKKYLKYRELMKLKEM